jgi:RND family efflux transporter MFP subunit
MSRAMTGAAAVIAVAIVLLALVAGGYIGAPRPTATPVAAPSPSPRGTPASTPRASATPRASIPSIEPTPVDNSVVASAIVVPQRSAELAWPLAGRIRELRIREQQEVVADQLLARLDPATQQAALDVATADVARAEAALARAQLRVDQLPPDATAAQIEAAQAELVLAETELEVARSTLTEAEVALGQTELRAPFAGTVAAIGANVGEQVAAAEPVVALGDLSSWYIETTDLSELAVVRVAVGDRATVTFGALPDLVVEGTVDRIQVRGTTDAGGVNFAVVIRPEEHHPELRWNLSATVRIAAAR